MLRQTRLTDPGGDAVRVECGDGPIWVVASEPLSDSGRQSPNRAAGRTPSVVRWLRSLSCRLVAQERRQLLDHVGGLPDDDRAHEPLVPEVEPEQVALDAIEPRRTTSSTPPSGSPSTCSWRSNIFVKNVATCS